MKRNYLLVSTIGPTTILFIVIALFFGLIFVKEVPPLWNLDETAHFSRAYQVSEGKFLPQKLPDGNYGGSVPVSIVTTKTIVDKDLAGLSSVELSATNLLSRDDLTHKTSLEDSARQKIDQPQKENLDFPGSAVYSPVAYIAPATGILACRLADCSLGSSIIITRVLSLAAYICMVAFAIWLLRRQKLRWLVFTVALLPVALFQASAVSADGSVIALALLLFALITKAYAEKRLSPTLIGLLTFIAILLPFIKISYGFLDLAALPVAILVHKDWRRALGWGITCLLVATILALGWVHLVRGPGRDIGTLQAANSSNSVVSARQQGRLIVRRPLKFAGVLMETGVTQESAWVYSTTGIFGLNSVQMPSVAVVSSYTLLLVATFYAASEVIRYRNRALLLGASSLLSVFSIFLVLYLTFTVVGKATIDGLQGRYFIPLLPFFLVAIAAIIPTRVVMSAKTALILFATSSGAILLSAVIYYGLATY